MNWQVYSLKKTPENRYLNACLRNYDGSFMKHRKGTSDKIAIVSYIKISVGIEIVHAGRNMNLVT